MTRPNLAINGTLCCVIIQMARFKRKKQPQELVTTKEMPDLTNSSSTV